MHTYKIISVVNDTALPESDLRSEHGLSQWIETPQGAVLLDSGGSGEVLGHNLEKLGLDAGRVQALVLSHAHDDHTGGLAYLLKEYPNLPVYAHPDIFRERFSRKENQYRSMGLPKNGQMLRGHSLLILNEEATQVLPGLWTTGAIRMRSEPEGRSANHFILGDVDWQVDPYRDDMSLVVETESGIILICGCCHAGLLNTLRQVRRQFDQPVRAVFGGTHLISADAAALQHVIDVLTEEYAGVEFFLNHCSGPDAIRRLREEFGDRVHEFPAGSKMEIK